MTLIAAIGGNRKKPEDFMPSDLVERTTHDDGGWDELMSMF